MVRVRRTMSCLLVLLASGCSEDGAAGGDGGGSGDLAGASALPDLAAAGDLALPDMAPVADLTAALGIGAPCPGVIECGAGLLCLSQRLHPTLPPVGYCTRMCNADPDCGADAFCGPALPGFASLCYLRCGANGACADPGHVCGRRLNGVIDLVNAACLPGNPAAREGSGCSTFADCNRNQTCLNNPFDFPGGYCATIGCKLGDDSTCVPGSPGLCVPTALASAACVARCNGDGDCRANEGYACVSSGPNVPRICLAPNPIGNNCRVPADCVGAGPWRCVVDMNLPAGYCTVANCDPRNNMGCPTNGHCAMLGNETACIKDCRIDAECAAGTRCRKLGIVPASPSGCLP